MHCFDNVFMYDDLRDQYEEIKSEILFTFQFLKFTEYMVYCFLIDHQSKEFKTFQHVTNGI